MKRRFSVVLAFVLLVSFTLNACSLQNKPYVRKDASEASPLKVARYESPNMFLYSEGAAMIVGFLGGFLGGIIGAIPVCIIYLESCKMPKDPNMPDFGKLVMEKFIQQAKKEIPNWPIMSVESQPIADALNDKTHFLLEFKVDSTDIEKSCGLQFRTVVTMRDKEGETIWRKGYYYESKNFNRETDYDILEKDNKKKLKEEIAFAADQTVKDFIEHFKNPKPEPQLQAQN